MTRVITDTLKITIVIMVMEINPTKHLHYPIS